MIQFISNVFVSLQDIGYQHQALSRELRMMSAQRNDRCLVENQCRAFLMQAIEHLCLRSPEDHPASSQSVASTGDLDIDEIKRHLIPVNYDMMKRSTSYYNGMRAQIHLQPAQG
ncbi:hypothetical protein An08g00650 [Aspergillus niger]|uniref:Uncharacterized protein n=2 Tax=Aspergillus niger TaxID=5061 RepID=A2QPY7_ASPNC|nr:hypothetical protein An08g00650 [Aspergillus niger]CAK45217.1 hypothetical protein An08g00650 [Aspergillus niger]